MRRDNRVGSKQIMTNTNKRRGEEENVGAVARNEEERGERRGSWDKSVGAGLGLM